MLKGFKDFLMRGNVVDLATAVVVGAAFTAIVTAFTSSIIEPLINSLGGTDAANGLGFTIRDGNPETFVDIGGLITAIINFVIVAAIVYFVIVMPYEKLKSFAARSGDDAAALSEAELLTEIRDILQGKDPVEEKAKITAAKSQKDETLIEREGFDGPPPGYRSPSGPPPQYEAPQYDAPRNDPPRQDPLGGPLPGHQPPAGPPPGYNPAQYPPQYGPPDYGPQGPGYRPDPLTGPPPGYRPPQERPDDSSGRHSQ